MKEFKKISIPDCQLCNAKNLQEVYDSPVDGRSWAYLCPECFKLHGSPSLASKIVKISSEEALARDNTKYDKKAELTWAEGFNFDELESIVMGDTDAPTACPEGCVVEPDGKCQHGYRSILLILGMI
jgi:hypothetical protein